jgi:hypothetical protein
MNFSHFTLLALLEFHNDILTDAFVIRAVEVFIDSGMLYDGIRNNKDKNVN